MPAAQSTRNTVALELVDVPENIRDLDPEHVDALAASIGLQGVLVPVVVRPAGKRFVLVAGFHRVGSRGHIRDACCTIEAGPPMLSAMSGSVETCRRRTSCGRTDRRSRLGGGFPTVFDDPRSRIRRWRRQRWRA